MGCGRRQTRKERQKSINIEYKKIKNRQKSNAQNASKKNKMITSIKPRDVNVFN